MALGRDRSIAGLSAHRSRIWTKAEIINALKTGLAHSLLRLSAYTWKSYQKSRTIKFTLLKNQTDEQKRLYGEVNDLVNIKVKGTMFQVPKNLELLRCFQYLDFKIAFENFCWNASCENCATQIKKDENGFQRTLCCQEPATEGLEVEDLPVGVRIKT